MKYFTEISLFFIVFFIFPNNMEALVAPKASPIAVESVFELDRNDLVQLDRKALQQKIGRKLKFKERIALKLVKENSGSIHNYLELKQQKKLEESMV